MPPLAAPRLESGSNCARPTKSEGRQNMLCACLSAALLVGLSDEEKQLRGREQADRSEPDALEAETERLRAVEVELAVRPERVVQLV